MALSTLLLPSSSTSTDSRRHHQQHHSKRKKKPPPPPPSFSPAPRTPPPAAGTGSRSHRAVSKSPRRAPATPSKASAKLVAANKNHRTHSKKKAPAAASSSSSSSSSSWVQLKSLLSCRSATAAARVHDPAAPSALARLRGGGAGACGASLCAIRDVVDGAASSSAVSVDRDTAPLTRSSRRAHRAAASSSTTGGGGHPSSLRGLSGCYECRAINVEPMSRRYPRPRELCPCSQCGEVFTKAESLEHHQAIRHAVSELGPEDSGRNIVEIIFKSSWQKRDRPICQIDRILKVHNAARTIARFEAYRDAVRARCRATPGAGAGARAAADGNELLRFHPAGLACELGLGGATSLCAAVADAASSSSSSSSSAAAPSGDACKCGVCAAIRHGFAPWAGAHPLGVRTTASSGRAHDSGAAASAAGAGCRAMLVCRVIAGQVQRDGKEGPFDSVAGDVDAASSVYGNLEELFVANPRAILPCFVVIYRVVE